MKKKLLSLALALALCLGLTVPAFAAELKIVQVSVPTVEEYEGTEYATWVFHEGLSRLYLYEDSSGIPTGAGFIDWTGRVVIPTEYDNASDFSEGFAAVYKNGKWGFIDKTGKEITSFQYDSTLDFREGMAAVKKGSKIGFIDTTGKEAVPCTYDDTKGFSQGLVAVKKGGKWGFIGKTGEEVIPFQYDDATSFFQGLAGVKKNGKWGFINKTNEAVIDFQYDDAGTFVNGLAPVKQGGKWGYIDKMGELVIPCAFDTAGYFSDGLAAVIQGGKWGYIDTTGKVVVPCKYGNAEPFSEGFAAVYSSDGGSWGFIDTTGKEVVPPKTFTENGVEYASSGTSIYGVSTAFRDGSVYINRYLVGGNKDNFVRYVYFTLTVDAKVSDWAREQVDSAAVKGLMPDCLGDDFTVNITRAEFAALAVELYETMSGEEAPAPGESPFTDTSDPVIIQANALGIVNGKGDGKFAPSDPVTRQEAALMLSRVYTRLGGEIPKVEATTFADNGDVASWAMDAVAFMSGKEIVNGVGNNKFDPQGNASIEQAMVIALRMFGNLDVE